MVYLNGKLVNNDVVHAGRHKFIGMFRNPRPPESNGQWSVLHCLCGENLWTVQAITEHWLKGHLDIPQYIDIGAENGGSKST